MRGLDKNSKEYKALRTFVRAKKVNPELDIKDFDDETREGFVSLMENYSKGFIACEMRRVMANDL